MEDDPIYDELTDESTDEEMEYQISEFEELEKCEENEADLFIRDVIQNVVPFKLEMEQLLGEYIKDPLRTHIINTNKLIKDYELLCMTQKIIKYVDSIRLIYEHIPRDTNNHPYLKKYNLDNDTVKVMLLSFNLKIMIRYTDDMEYAKFEIYNKLVYKLKKALRNNIRYHYYAVIDYLNNNAHENLKCRSPTLKFRNKQIWAELPFEIIEKEYYSAMRDMFYEHNKKFPREVLDKHLRVIKQYDGVWINLKLD